MVKYYVSMQGQSCRWFFIVFLYEAKQEFLEGEAGVQSRVRLLVHGSELSCLLHLLFITGKTDVILNWTIIWGISAADRKIGYKPEVEISLLVWKKPLPTELLGT